MTFTFEKFLEERAPAGVHTNNSPEGFERWLENLDISEVMDFAQEYGDLRAAHDYDRQDADNEFDTIRDNAVK